MTNEELCEKAREVVKAALDASPHTTDPVQAQLALDVLRLLCPSEARTLGEVKP